MLGCCTIEKAEELCSIGLCLKAVMSCILRTVFCFVDIPVGAPVEIAFPVRLCRMEKLNAELLSEIHKT